MEEQQLKQIKLNEWFNKIIELHGFPSFVLLKIEKDTRFTLLGVASNEETLKTILERKAQEKMYYVG